MAGGQIVTETDIKSSDTVELNQNLVDLEDYDDFEDLYDLEDLDEDDDYGEDEIDLEDAVVVEVAVKEENQDDSKQNDNNEEKKEDEPETDEDSEDEESEGIYTFEKVKEIYLSVTQLSEFEEFYKAYITDFMERQGRRTSRIKYVKALYLDWHPSSFSSRKRRDT